MSGGFGLSANATMAAEPLVLDEARHRNKWVAVRRGHVLAEADTEPDLIEAIAAAGLERGTYVVRFIDEPPTGFVVGVG